MLKPGTARAERVHGDPRPDFHQALLVPLRNDIRRFRYEGLLARSCQS